MKPKYAYVLVKYRPQMNCIGKWIFAEEFPRKIVSNVEACYEIGRDTPIFNRIDLNKYKKVK